MLWFHPCLAQESISRFGSLPSVNLNKKLSKNYKLNYKAESRQVISTSDDLGFSYDRTDLSLVLSTKTGLSHILAGGYMLRVKEGNLIHRFIQQFSIVNDHTIRIAHRIVTDQTFGDSFQWRLRYRLSALFPLSGDLIDPTEFYLKLQNEYLHVFSDSYDLEIRAIASLGYMFHDGNKIELGIDNRYNSFIDSPIKKRHWLILGWYLVI